MTLTLKRNQAIRALRYFFHEQGCIEVRTPKCVLAGAMEPYIDAFELESRHSGHVGYLASSPEFALKKIFAAELEHNPTARGIYEIAPVFRDDRKSKLHLMEFTMVEWYVRNTERGGIVNMAVELIRYLASVLEKNIAPPLLKKVDLREVFLARNFRLDFNLPHPYSRLYSARYGSMPQHVNALDGEIICFNLLFDEIVLPLISAIPGIVAVEGFPDCLAALARCDEKTAERTELFVSGVEIANAYSEEFDSAVIRRRWQAYNEIRRLHGVPEHPVDEELLEAANSMQNVCGIALGLERCLMILRELKV